MSDTCTVALYDVQKCGYYKRKQSDPEFGSLGEVLTEISGWAQGLSLQQTAVPGALAADGKPIWCCAVAGPSSTGDFVLTLFNPTQSVRGRVASVSPSATVGAADIESTGVKDGTVPGFPSYYYVMPNKDLVAAVTFHGFPSEMRSFQSYLRNFMKFASQHAVPRTDDKGNLVKNDDGAVEILGYQRSEDSDVVSAEPRLNWKAKWTAALLDKIRAERGAIRKVVRRAELDTNAAEERKLVAEVFEFLHIGDGRRKLPNTVAVETFVGYTPSSIELERIITRADLGTSWERIGFRFQDKPSKTHWLSRARASRRLELTVAKQGIGYDAKSLLDALVQKRTLILGRASRAAR
ncbi:MAG: hypothetical protein ACF8XB_00575 [Planctomycetota bacterium JB042]